MTEPTELIESTESTESTVDLTPTDTELTYSEIFKQLLSKEDIIIVIGGEDLHRLRKGISGVKARDNAKLKSFDLPIEKFKIEYDILEKNTEEKTIKLRIRIVKPDTVVIKSMIKSEGL
jgi:hypothetical protein